MPWKKITQGLIYDVDSDTIQPEYGGGAHSTRQVGEDPPYRVGDPRCKICNAILSQYNKSDQCSSHSVKPEPEQDEPVVKPPLQTQPRKTVPKQVPVKSEKPKVTIFDPRIKCRHDVMQGTCAICLKERKRKKRKK